MCLIFMRALSVHWLFHFCAKFLRWGGGGGGGQGVHLNPETPCNVEIKVIFYMSYGIIQFISTAPKH